MTDRKILIIDDNRDTLRTYATAISYQLPQLLIPDRSDQGQPPPSVRVITCDRTDDALFFIEDRSVDVIVVDLKMDGARSDNFSGLEILKRSIEIDPNRPVIVITGYGTIDIVREAMGSGAFDFIR